MHRTLLFALVACAHGVSRPNPPAPVEDRAVPYSGRIVLATGALREQVDGFADAWTRRLAILGIEARITYDDDRAVFDVYGTPADDLPRIAGLLADRGGWYLDGTPHDGALITWLPPTPECDCDGRVRVALDRRRMCNMTSGTHELLRAGDVVRLHGKVYWAIANVPRYVDRAPGVEPCPSQHYWPDNLVFALPRGSTPQQRVAIVLGLAGGTLPEAPAIVAVTRGAS